LEEEDLDDENLVKSDQAQHSYLSSYEFQDFGLKGSDTAKGDTACAMDEKVKVDEWLSATDSRVAGMTDAQRGQKRVLFNVISPDSVIQGAIGDCWFVSAMAAIAEYPAKIRQIFGNQSKISEDGQYTVTLFHPGQNAFVKISVNDKCPVTYLEEDDPRFRGASPSLGAEIWPMILEKAFAKLCGSYMGTVGGHVASGLQFLCGGNVVTWAKNAVEKSYHGLVSGIACVVANKSWRKQVLDRSGYTDQIPLGRDAYGELGNGAKAVTHPTTLPTSVFLPDENAINDKQLWANMKEYTRKAYVMCAEIERENDDMHGLAVGHAYSLLAAREVNLDGCIVPMVKIRNPHGRGEWTGDYSDSSDKWKEHGGILQEILGHIKDDQDGSFWMHFNDFAKYFDSVVVLCVRMPLQGVHVDKLRACQALF